MILILDAYNVLHSVREFQTALDQSLQTARHALAHFCEALLHRRGDISDIYLVFDGAHVSPEFYEEPQGPLWIIFSQPDEDADDRIIELMDTLPSSLQMTVVSRDNYVMNHARSRGASILSPDAFYEKYSPPSKMKTDSKEKKSLSRHQKDDITQAYKKYLGLQDDPD